jgi:hypothetical protein
MLAIHEEQMFLAVVITNASKIGRTAYFVDKCSQIFYWSNEYKVFG